MLFHRGQVPAGCPCTTGLVGEGIAGLIFIAQTHRLPGELTVLAHPHVQQVTPVVDLGHINYALGHRDLIAMLGGGHTLQRSLQHARARQERLGVSDRLDVTRHIHNKWSYPAEIGYFAEFVRTKRKLLAMLPHSFPAPQRYSRPPSPPMFGDLDWQLSGRSRRFPGA